MPGFDGTGPQGLGPRTGGGFGFCPPTAGPAQNPNAFGYGNPWFGVGRGGWPRGGGRGRAWGGGRGGRWRAYAGPRPFPVYPEGVASQTTFPNEAEYIRQQLDFLAQQGEALRARLDELEQSETAGS